MVIVKGDCPHCKEKIDFDPDKLKFEERKNNELKNMYTSGQTTQQIEQKPEPEIKEVIKAVSPADEPFYSCKNGNCDIGMHKNPNYSKKPNKKCKNCDSLNGSKKCKNCGNSDKEEFEDIDDEDLESLGIPMPAEQEHNHDHED